MFTMKKKRKKKKVNAQRVRLGKGIKRGNEMRLRYLISEKNGANENVSLR